MSRTSSSRSRTEDHEVLDVGDDVCDVEVLNILSVEVEDDIFDLEDVARNVEVLNVLDIEDKVKDLDDED